MCAGGSIDRIVTRNTAIEMLRLCPSDNLGQRDWVGTLLLKVNRPADALSFIQQWLELEVCETGSPPLRGGCVFKTPSQEPMPRSTVKKLGKYTQSNLVYTAAVATFKSWGDCELARQYLVIASKLNSTILRGVILSKIDQPSKSSYFYITYLAE